MVYLNSIFVILFFFVFGSTLSVAGNVDSLASDRHGQIESLIHKMDQTHKKMALSLIFLKFSQIFSESPSFQKINSEVSSGTGQDPLEPQLPERITGHVLDAMTNPGTSSIDLLSKDFSDLETSAMSLIQLRSDTHHSLDQMLLSWRQLADQACSDDSFVSVLKYLDYTQGQFNFEKYFRDFQYGAEFKFGGESEIYLGPTSQIDESDKDAEKKVAIATTTGALAYIIAGSLAGPYGVAVAGVAIAVTAVTKLAMDMRDHKKFTDQLEMIYQYDHELYEAINPEQDIRQYFNDYCRPLHSAFQSINPLVVTALNDLKNLNQLDGQTRQSIEVEIETLAQELQAKSDLTFDYQLVERPELFSKILQKMYLEEILKLESILQNAIGFSGEFLGHMFDLRVHIFDAVTYNFSQMPSSSTQMDAHFLTTYRLEQDFLAFKKGYVANLVKFHELDDGSYEQVLLLHTLGMQLAAFRTRSLDLPLFQQETFAIYEHTYQDLLLKHGIEK